MSESTSSIPIYEVTTLQQPVPVTRSRSKINDDITSNSSEVSELSSDLTKTESVTEIRDGKRKRKRKSSPSHAEEPQLKKQEVSPGEGRKLRSVMKQLATQFVKKGNLHKIVTGSGRWCLETRNPLLQNSSVVIFNFMVSFNSRFYDVTLLKVLFSYFQ